MIDRHINIFVRLWVSGDDMYILLYVYEYTLIYVSVWVKYINVHKLKKIVNSYIDIRGLPFFGILNIWREVHSDYSNFISYISEMIKKKLKYFDKLNLELLNIELVKHKKDI